MVAFKTIFMKELEDHFNSWRFITVFLIIFIPCIYFIWRVVGNIQQITISAKANTFISMFTHSLSEDPIALLPNSFFELIVFLLPVVGIALGLDAINSERNNGTLSRLVAQPVYRDNIINAKFLAGVFTISIVVISVVLLACGLGIRLLGIVPGAEEAWRILFFIIFSIVYGCFWLGLSILFSILFKRVASSALVAITVWLFFAIFFPLIQQLIVNALDYSTSEAAIQSLQTMITISRISPIQLFRESAAQILVPGAITMAQYIQLMTEDTGNFYLMTNNLSLGQSMLTVWPQLIITVLLTLICFAISYVKFMYEEIRAT
ncbi:MAG: ABC transporter permease subunit [Dehalococcoidales bacterium]|nr:ABC transporter permease subunit [Dehalococcoidales bacterium]